MNATILATRFRVSALPGRFADRVRFTLRDDFKRPVSVRTATGGEPLRDLLRRSTPGEPIILCSYQAVPLPSPYAEIGPIFISAEPGASSPPGEDELPAGYFKQPFAVRAYNRDDVIEESALVEPQTAAPKIHEWFERPEVAYVHARFGGHGCFACRIDRA